VAISDVLPLKVARRDAIANLNLFGSLGQERLKFDVSFAFSMRRHLIPLTS